MPSSRAKGLIQHLHNQQQTIIRHFTVCHLHCFGFNMAVLREVSNEGIQQWLCCCCFLVPKCGGRKFRRNVGYLSDERHGVVHQNAIIFRNWSEIWGCQQGRSCRVARLCDAHLPTSQSKQFFFYISQTPPTIRTNSSVYARTGTRASTL
jgi:hypothetical protein